MAWEIAYRCDRCRLVLRVRTGDYRFYVVPWHGEGIELFDRIPCSDQEGWCRRCRRLRSMESIPEIAVLERMKVVMTDAGMSELDRKLASDDGRNGQCELQRRIARIDERIRWRKERMSPPKCFACGSTEVETVERARGGEEGFRHPECGGFFRICEDPCHIQPLVGFLIPAEGPSG
jgi:uncharacterized C2H2 Zn-finger protein